MRTALGILLAAASVLAVGCRDEQAGPRSNPGAPGQQQMPPPRPPAPPAPGAGQSRASGNPQAPLTPGAILDAAPSNMTSRSGATWGGGAVQYLGSKLEPAKAKPGQPLKISHYFKALKPQPKGWQFFVHLVEPNTMQMLANLDHEVQQGAMPLGNWPEGKVVEDVHGIMVPQGFNGSLRVLMGFWQGEQRM